MSSACRKSSGSAVGFGPPGAEVAEVLHPPASGQGSWIAWRIVGWRYPSSSRGFSRPQSTPVIRVETRGRIWWKKEGQWVDASAWIVGLPSEELWHKDA